jgi:hypothetical protein
LNEYLVKGFTMDDERLKNPPGQGAEGLLRRATGAHPRHPLVGAALLPEGAGYLRDERGLHEPNTEHVAAVLRHGAEQDALGDARAHGGGGDSSRVWTPASRSWVLQTTRPGGIIRKADVSIAKNYLTARTRAAGAEPDRDRLYIEYAELRALRTQGDDDARLDHEAG